MDDTEEKDEIARRTKLRHDLRTPINQIIGYSELLEEEAADRGVGTMVPDLQKIASAARRMLKLVEEIFSGAEPVRGGTVERQAAAQIVAAIPASPQVVSAEETATLLVADDDELNRDMLVRRLQASGYTVEGAEDGERVLEKIEQHPYDLLLLDVMMPGLNGIDVLKMLRERRGLADLPVIMATAMDESHMIVEALRIGANDYVTKPLDFPVVLARVRTQLALKRAKDAVQRLAESLEIRNRFIRATFGRYLSDEIVASILETPEGLKLGGEKRRVTLMMSDVRGFTALSETLAPEHVVRMLNNYLGAMAGIIRKYNGTIDEFIGDAIFTIFGAPVLREDDASRAAACAIEMQLAMEQVNAQNQSEGYPRIEMGIALNTGEVVVGNIGSEARAKYGVVGSEVNLTARIESNTVGRQILVSEATRIAAPELVTGDSMDVQVKGVREPIRVYDVKGIGGAFNLQLPERDEALVTLVESIPVKFSIVEGKNIASTQYDAALVRASLSVAELQTSVKVTPFSNLRLQISVNGASSDVYAKVASAAADLVSLRFTSVPPEVEKLLGERIASATRHG